MDIVWFRDLVIVIAGIVGIILMIVLGIMACVILRRVNDMSKSVKKISDSTQEVLVSVKAVTDNVASVSSFACEEMAEPLVRTAGLLQGMFRGLSVVLEIFKKRK